MIFQNFLSFWRQPFNAQGGVVSWALFTGLILVIIFLWSRVLREAGHVIGSV